LLLQSFLHSVGSDVFVQIASRWLSKPEMEVNAKDRELCKSLCYGILYGMGSRSMAEQLQLPVEIAANLIESFKKTYSEVTKFCNKILENCRSTGYIETICGHRRYIPTINSKDDDHRSSAERMAVNSLFQGSAADVMKVAMINIVNKIQDYKPMVNADEHFDIGRAKKCPRLVLQIHDELLFEVPEVDLPTVQKIVREQMESALKENLTVPLVVRMKGGKSWGSMTAITFRTV